MQPEGHEGDGMGARQRFGRLAPRGRAGAVKKAVNEAGWWLLPVSFQGNNIRKHACSCTLNPGLSTSPRGGEAGQGGPWPALAKQPPGDWVGARFRLRGCAADLLRGPSPNAAPSRGERTRKPLSHARHAPTRARAPQVTLAERRQSADRMVLLARVMRTLARQAGDEVPISSYLRAIALARGARPVTL